MLKLIFALIAVAVAVPAGGLLAGVDRRVTARLQSRQGPPLLQPFYDVLKLFGKAPCVTNPWLIFSSYVCLMASAIALLMFFMQGDMLLLFFVMTVGAVFKVAGALSADSPYSNVHRAPALRGGHMPVKSTQRGDFPQTEFTSAEDANITWGPQTGWPVWGDAAPVSMPTDNKVSSITPAPSADSSSPPPPRGGGWRVRRDPPAPLRPGRPAQR